MNRPTVWEAPALALVVVATFVTVLTVPLASWRSSFADPCHLAVVSAVIVVIALLVTRSLGERGLRIERRVLTSFLAAMPIVYVASWLWVRPSEDGVAWLGIELVAVPVYGALAYLGFRRSPWFLAVGIAAHGLGWDAWHYGRTSFIPTWYAVGCLVVDVAIALYVVTRAHHFPALRRSTLAATAAS